MDFVFREGSRTYRRKVEHSKYLIVVGRAEDGGTFFNNIQSAIVNEYFAVEGLHSLEEFSEIDKKDRYIAFLSSPLEEEFDERAAELITKFRMMSYGAASFESLEEAIAYAFENYGFESDDAKRQEQFSETRARFPHFTAQEWEQIHIFDSLYHTGKIKPIPARFNDERAIVLAHITVGTDMVRVTPMMILVSDEMHDELEIPFKES